jgi:hypothetical protein
MALIYHRQYNQSTALRNYDFAENNIINNIISLPQNQQNQANQKKIFLVMMSIFISSIAYGLLLVFRDRAFDCV